MSQKSISMNLRNDHIAILYAKIKNKMGHANLYDLESINRSMQGSTYLKTANAFGKITFINHVQLCTDPYFLVSRTLCDQKIAWDQIDPVFSNHIITNLILELYLINCILQSCLLDYIWILQ